MSQDVDGLRDDQWERRKGFVPGGTTGKGGARADDRRFLDAPLWMARSGGRWRDLPARLGEYQSVKRRYYRWIERGVLDVYGLAPQKWRALFLKEEGSDGRPEAELDTGL